VIASVDAPLVIHSPGTPSAVTFSRLVSSCTCIACVIVSKPARVSCAVGIVSGVGRDRSICTIAWSCWLAMLFLLRVMR
jgi:hypothetical protein